MKLTFYSNFLNHHQLPFCLELYKRLGSDFTFVANEPTPQERLNCGWENMNDKYSFVLKKYENKENEMEALELAKSSDIVILGDSSDSYKIIREKTNKLFFRETERLFKEKSGIFKKIKQLYSCNSFFKSEKKSYLLCMGAYVYKDFLSFNCYRNRALKFGYFPLTYKLDISKVINEKQENSFIWVGRFISWKRPEFVIYLAKKLKSLKLKFHITMIGDGELFNKIKSDIRQNDLNSYISLTGSLSNDDVRKQMLSHKYHLFTSNQEEGWGAVLNESMNSGCVAIANKKNGSVPYLLKVGFSGFVFNNSYKSFEKCVIKVINTDESAKKEIAERAYATIRNEWNAEIAADRFIKICSDLLKKNDINNTYIGLLSKENRYQSLFKKSLSSLGFFILKTLDYIKHLI